MTTLRAVVEDEEEVIGEPISTSRALRRAFVEAPTLRRGLIVTLLLSVLGTVGQLIVPVVVQQMTDRELLSETGPRIEVVITEGGLAIVLLFVTALFTRAAVIRLNNLTAGGLRELRVKLFAHLHRLSILARSGRTAGRPRLKGDERHLHDPGLHGVGWDRDVDRFSPDPARPGGHVLLQWRLALLVLLGVIVYVVMLLFFQRVLQKAQDQVREKVADSLSVMGETITGLSVIRAHGVEETAIARVDKVLQIQVQAEHKANRLSAILFSSAELFAAGITAMVIAVGIVLGAAEGTTAGALLAFLFLVNLMIEPIQTLVETVDQAQRAAAGVRRVLRVLDSPIDIPDPVDGVDLPAGPLGVSLHDVTYRYPSGPVVLSQRERRHPGGKKGGGGGRNRVGQDHLRQAGDAADRARGGRSRDWRRSTAHGQVFLAAESGWHLSPRRAFSSTRQSQRTSATARHWQATTR